MSNPTNITYGSYDFARDCGPIPFLTIKKDIRRLADGSNMGSFYTLSLNGELNKVPSGTTGYNNVDHLQDLLLSGFKDDFKEFKVTCDTNILIQQYPKVNSITLSPTSDNWTQSTDFTIDLEWVGETYSGYSLESATETWDFEFDQSSSYYRWQLPGGTGDNNMYLFSLGHNVSAKGLKTDTINSPWEEARRYVSTQLGYKSQYVSNTGVFNLDATTFSGWNHSRVQNIDKLGGSFSVTEKWVVANTGFQNNCGNAIEDFTATVNYDNQAGLTSVSLNGTIKGMEEISYGSTPGSFSIVKNKYDNASGFWNNLLPKLPGRASLVCNKSMNYNPINWSIGHNPTQGSITYNYTYDNRPCNYVAGALYEDINITDDHPTDVFAEIAILGRPWGPILQRMSTVTSKKRTVNYSASLGPLTGCSNITGAIAQKPNISSLLCQLQQAISGANTLLFKSADNESWNIKTGQYSRSVSWTYSDCTGTPPNTSFC